MVSGDALRHGWCNGSVFVPTTLYPLVCLDSCVYPVSLARRWGAVFMGVLVSVCSVYTRRRFASLIPGGSGFDFHSDFGLYVAYIQVITCKHVVR
jgi:hypothetical protein